MKWNKATKEKLSYIAAFTAFLFGLGMTIAGFIANPHGEVHDSVLWVLGQSLTYSAAIFGVGLYVHGTKQSLEEDIFKRLKQRHEEDAEEEGSEKS